jgi:hypothetical protein
VSKASARRGTGDSIANYAVVLLGFVAVAVVVVLFVGARQQERLPEVDYTADAAALAEFAPYTAYTPEDTPQGWTPTSSRLDDGGALAGGEPQEPVTWDLGFATASDEYASLRISDAEPREFIAEMTQNGEADGEQMVDGEQWERYVGDEGQLSLVRETEDATLVVTGTADYEELAELAASLEPQP